MDRRRRCACRDRLYSLDGVRQARRAWDPAAGWPRRHRSSLPVTSPTCSARAGVHVAPIAIALGNGVKPPVPVRNELSSPAQSSAISNGTPGLALAGVACALGVALPLGCTVDAIDSVVVRREGVGDRLGGAQGQELECVRQRGDLLRSAELARRDEVLGRSDRRHRHQHRHVAEVAVRREQRHAAHAVVAHQGCDVGFSGRIVPLERHQKELADLIGDGHPFHDLLGGQARRRAGGGSLRSGRARCGLRGLGRRRCWNARLRRVGRRQADGHEQDEQEKRCADSCHKSRSDAGRDIVTRTDAAVKACTRGVNEKRAVVGGPLVWRRLTLPWPCLASSLWLTCSAAGGRCRSRG